MLVDRAEHVAELVQHHAVVFVGVGVVVEPAVVHGRFVLADGEVIRPDVGPGAGIRIEGNANLRILAGAEFEADVGIFHPLQRMIDNTLLLNLAAIHKRDRQLRAVDPFLPGQQRDFRRMVRHAGQPRHGFRRVGRIMFHRDFRGLYLFLVGNNTIDTKVCVFDILRFLRCHAQPSLV